MTELSHSGAQIYAMKDFRYLFRLKKSEQVPVILELNKHDNCPIFDDKSILFKMCIFCNELVVFNWSLFLNQKSHRAGLALKLQGFN